MSASLYDEFDAVAARFGVDLQQVRRDHLLSHVLAAISAGISTDDVVFRRRVRREGAYAVGYEGEVGRHPDCRDSLRRAVRLREQPARQP